MMRVCNSSYIFQAKMNGMFRGIKIIITCNDELLIITKGDLYDHLNKFEHVMKILRMNGLKCNIEKLFFGHTKMNYLGLWVKRTGIWPVNKKVEAIVNITPPIDQEQVHSFIDLVN